MSLKHVLESHPPNTYTFEPIRVVVCARKFECGAPEIRACDQYMPEAGAGGTSGASSALWSGGKGIWCARDCRSSPVRRLVTVAENDAVADEVVLSAFERPVIAEVERIGMGFFWSLSPSLATGGLLTAAELAPLEVDGRDEAWEET